VGRAPGVRALRRAAVGRRALGGLQGPLLPLPDHAGVRRSPEGRVGHPRAARRGRGGEAAGHHGQEPDRGTGGHRRVHPALPRVGAQLRRRVEGPHPADRLLDRHRRRLLDVLDRVRRGGLVQPEGPLGPGPAVRGHQGGAVLPALWHGAVQPRARAARRLPGRGRRVGLCPLPPGRRGHRPGRPPAPGPGADHPGGAVAGGVDHDPVDAGVQHRCGGGPGARLRRRR